MDLKLLLKKAQGNFTDEEFGRLTGILLEKDLGEILKGTSNGLSMLKKVVEISRDPSVNIIELLVAAGLISKTDLTDFITKNTSLDWVPSDTNVVSIENGLHLNGVEVSNLVKVNIDSGISNFTVVTISFLAKVKGIDYLTEPSTRYKFSPPVAPTTDEDRNTK